MDLTPKQSEIMDAEGHLLVTGGPGSGKTTVSILKAARIAEEDLLPERRVLFLSFARATVSRVVEAIEHEQQIPREQKRRIEVETYHSFFWRILKAHGYLIGLPRRLTILTPPSEAIALASIRSQFKSGSKLSPAEMKERNDLEEAERQRLARDEGSVCFSLFATYVGEILNGSVRVCRLISTMYPTIILDEFQDTNFGQWNVVKALGGVSTLFALADPEQRIYDWIGADPERLNHFRAAFAPTEIDLSQDNHRSPGTDIAKFGNDLLSGGFTQETYEGIDFVCYEANGAMPMTALVKQTYEARKRLVDSGKQDWSLAILVPTKRMTRFVSDALRVPPAGMTRVHHRASIELDAAILGAEIIAVLMQPFAELGHFDLFLSLLRNYFHGRGGDSPTKGDIKEADGLRKAYEEWLERSAVGKPIKKNSVLVGLFQVYETVRSLQLSGDPDLDWQNVRSLLEKGPCSRLRDVADDVRAIRLLERGTQFRQALSQDWRDNGCYLNALSTTRRSFVQEHFSTNSRPESGVVVMNMHKAKGKQFDEVIIYESYPRRAKGKIVANFDRIVRGNDRNAINDQVRQNFRVSVTRGKKRVTIMTPKIDPCVLLLP
ncbi:ATP-dependent helicase [Aromatoleum evansii]|uniref:ATP-dependent helicase n=1 Tax=Aromatoleum evansii TaxID=59406 RepID=UPI00145E4F60|nr:ATP-dependent helicase [Aromatoleum evansii]NMG27817.1 AAA family ATPase [Aromatoleum evansii]